MDFNIWIQLSGPPILGELHPARTLSPNATTLSRLGTISGGRELSFFFLIQNHGFHPEGQCL